MQKPHLSLTLAIMHACQLNSESNYVIGLKEFEASAWPMCIYIQTAVPEACGNHRENEQKKTNLTVPNNIF